MMCLKCFMDVFCYRTVIPIIKKHADLRTLIDLSCIWANDRDQSAGWSPQIVV